MKPPERQRHKAIAIPTVFDGREPKFLVVRDKRYDEWTFVTGGCTDDEIKNPLRCAVRELEEETRGVVVVRKGQYSSFEFNVTAAMPQGDEYEVTYHVFVFDVHVTSDQRRKQIAKFDRRLDTCVGVWDENDAMSWETMGNFKSRTNMWPMIREHVVNSVKFARCLTSPRLTRFIIPPTLNARRRPKGVRGGPANGDPRPPWRPANAGPGDSRGPYSPDDDRRNSRGLYEVPPQTDRPGPKRRRRFPMGRTYVPAKP